ncbi:MAG: DUF2283 domain-containing protein [Pseudomonadota bacterium]
MYITHEPENDIGYIYFKKKKMKIKETITINDVNIDIATDGSVLGIELMNANDQIGKKIIYKNQKTQQEITL